MKNRTVVYFRDTVISKLREIDLLSWKHVLTSFNRVVSWDDCLIYNQKRGTTVHCFKGEGT